MSIPLLPKLNSENKIAITKRGVWQSESQNTLGNLVVDLKVAANAESDITSIPDLWARPSMYEMVLFDEKHHLHQKFLNEWRGLLAIMAFREMRGFNAIERTELLVPEVSKISDDMPRFLKVVAMLLPESYKAYSDDTIKKDGYYKIQMLTCNKKALAILWPSILLCPAINPVRGNFKVDWWSGNDITDPICELNEQDKALLYQWLENIKNGLNNNAVKLMQLLADFQRDLQVDKKPDNYSEGTGINITGFCNLIDKPIRCTVDGAQFLKNSNVMLVDKRKLGSKKLLVMTPDIGERWNMSLNDIVVAGTCNMQTALPFGGKLFQTDRLNNEDLNPYNAELIMGEDFFTDKIYLINQEKSPFSHDKSTKPLNYRGTKHVLLPIKKLLLDYLEPDDILRNFRITTIDDMDIKVELAIPLSGFDQQGKNLIISKIYHGNRPGENDKQEIIGMDDGMPLITIWPNFIPNDERNWQAYYSYYNDIGENTFIAEPLWNDAEFERREIDSRKTLGIREVFVKGKSFPDGYSCKVSVDTPSGDKEYEVGLIILDKPSKLAMPYNKVCKIGVDFGTTNTLAYMSIDGENNILHFANRLYDVTNFEDRQYIKKGYLRRRFFSASEQPSGDAVSVRTAFNPNLKDPYNGNLEQPVFPGVAYLLDAAENVDNDGCVENLQQGKEMKWDAQNGAKFRKYFLLHIGLLCLAEAVANGATDVKWYYSYPKALNRVSKDGLKRIWQEDILKFYKEEVSPIVDTEVGEKTESVAMAEYFKNHISGMNSRGLICLDIGGGSTDIAVWQGNTSEKAKGQCSIKFAGNDILNKQLFKNKKILNQFKNNNEDFNNLIDQVCSKTKEKEFNMGLEALLRYHEKTFLDSLVTKNSDTDIKIFVRNIAFALAGIFYYVGMHLGQLNKDGEIVLESMPHCCVGGNASKLLDWVSNGKYESNSVFAEIAIMCLGQGLFNINNPSELEEDWFEIYRSPNPKEEVAYGLVAASSTSDVVNQFSTNNRSRSLRGRLNNNSENNEGVFAGENFSINNSSDFKAFITVEDVKNGVKVDKNLPLFRNFVEQFNDLVKQCGYGEEYIVGFENKDFITIRDAINDIFAEESRKSEKEINLEPPFISILKNALERLY